MNIIHIAAHAAHVTDATRVLREALGIPPSKLDDLCMTEQWRWSQLEAPGRIAHIRIWLDSQCYEVANAKPGPTPMQTVGTND